MIFTILVETQSDTHPVFSIGFLFAGDLPFVDAGLELSLIRTEVIMVRMPIGNNYPVIVRE